MLDDSGSSYRGFLIYTSIKRTPNHFISELKDNFNLLFWDKYKVQDALKQISKDVLINLYTVPKR